MHCTKPVFSLLAQLAEELPLLLALHLGGEDDVGMQESSEVKAELEGLGGLTEGDDVVQVDVGAVGDEVSGLELGLHGAA